MDSDGVPGLGWGEVDWGIWGSSAQKGVGELNGGGGGGSDEMRWGVRVETGRIDGVRIE